METGYKTPEFWITVIVDIAAAIIAILSVRGLVSPEEGELWLTLVQAIATPVALVVMALVTQKYVEGQTEVRKTLIAATGSSVR